MIKKIIFSFKSWFISPLESDTVLGYVFAHDFQHLEQIFNSFLIEETIPFTISNAFPHGYIPRPFTFWAKTKEKFTLENALNNERYRKKLKNINIIPIEKDILEYALNSDRNENEESHFFDLLKNFSLTANFDQKITLTHTKNKISRFSQETTPYEIDNIKYSNNERCIYVKIKDNEQFTTFYMSLEKTFKILGRWAKKSIGYWKINNIRLEEINDKEKILFSLCEKKQKKGIYYILNNYKPTNTELTTLDLSKSQYKISYKQAKTATTQDQQMPFKWQYAFLTPGSVLFTKEKLKGNNYIQKGEDKNAFNFWYIF